MEEILVAECHFRVLKIVKEQSFSTTSKGKEKGVLKRVGRKGNKFGEEEFGA